MINYILLKIASRCNYDCSYCYWFRDSSVKSLPALMPEEVIDAFLSALEDHLTSNALRQFVCSFHGGEPTLFGARRLREFLRRITTVGTRTGCTIRFAITTNASLINQDWLDLIRDFSISVAVSIDGPRDVHDKRRKSVKGTPTWHETVTGYLSLCRAGIKPSIIAVCDPNSSPVSVLDHFAKDLGAQFCDILIPDANHSDQIDSISSYYIALFDHWYDHYMDGGLEVRILTDFIRGLLGLQTRTDSIGFAPMQTVCLSPSGQLEPHDVLRIAGADRIRTSCSIFSHRIADIEKDSLWQSVREASLDLSETCKSCRYLNACGGGHLAQRWSIEKAYNNPSVYCEDFINIFDHIAERLKADIEIGTATAKLNSDSIYAAITSGRAATMLML